MALKQGVSRLDATITGMQGVLAEANALILQARDRSDAFEMAKLKLLQVQTTLALTAFELGMAGVQEEDAFPDGTRKLIDDAVCMELKKVKNHIKLTMPAVGAGDAWDAVLTFLDAEMAARAWE